MNPTTRTLTPSSLHFRIEDYHRLAELGFLGEDDPIELVRGELIKMAAKGTAHETCITRLLRVLMPMVGDRATLRCQSPIVIADHSEPEPDITFVDNREDDYATAHPTAAAVQLLIEVADSSLEYDRTVKLMLYAEAEIPHYWLFNLVDRTLEAYSEPAQITPTTFGYLNRRIVPATGAIALPITEQLLPLSRIFP